MSNEEIIVELVKYELGLLDELPEFDYSTFINQRIIKITNNSVEVSILKNTNFSIIDDDVFLAFIKRFRSKFKNQPQLNGNLGVKAKTIDRMKWFIIETGLSIEQIEKATDNYIEDCKVKNRFLMDPHHFIWKQDSARKKSLTDSKLYSVFEDMDEQDDQAKTSYEL